jgi:hypothetical protein
MRRRISRRIRIPCRSRERGRAAQQITERARAQWMQRFGVMMEFAKDMASNIGCVCADAAKFVGSHGADAAKIFGIKSADAAKFVGSHGADAAKFAASHTADAAKFVGGKSADAARFVGEGAVDIAKRVGPKRGLIGLVVIGGAIVGGIYLSRYLRSRAAAAADEGEDFKDKRVKKAASRAVHAAQGVTH